MKDCPKCGVEYRDDFTRCAVCGTELEPLPAETADDGELVAVLTTHDLVQLAIVKSLLDSADVSYVVQGEEGLRLLPLRPGAGLLSAESSGAVLRVRRCDAEEVRQVLDQAGRVELPDDLE